MHIEGEQFYPRNVLRALAEVLEQLVKDFGDSMELAIVVDQIDPTSESSIGSPSLWTRSIPNTSSAYPFPSLSIPSNGISPGLRHIAETKSSCRKSTPVSKTWNGSTLKR